MLLYVSARRHADGISLLHVLHRDAQCGFTTLRPTHLHGTVGWLWRIRTATAIATNANRLG